MNRRTFLSAGAAILIGCRRPGDDRDGPEGELAFASLPAEERIEAPPAPGPILGINSHLLEEEDLRLIRELGITHVRSTLYTQLWSELPHYQVAMRSHSERAADYGLGLLLVVHNAFGPVFRMGHDLAAGRRYLAMMTGMVRQLPTVESWQLWNEQDVWVQSPFGAGSVPAQSPERVGQNYARWWRDAYPALKEINPHALLVTGGPADHADNRWRGFLRGMIESGAQMDAVGIHVYGSWDRVRPRVLEAREIVGGRAPLWLTECGGLPGSGWTPHSHAEAWRSVIEGNERERLLERIYPYALQTDPNDPWHGVFEVDGRPRPVLLWLRERAARN